MNKRWLLLGISALSLASLALAACGGDDDDDGGSDDTENTSATATAPSNATQTTGGSGGSASPAATTGSGGGGGVTGSGADDLKRLAKDLSNKTYSVSYNYTETKKDNTVASKGTFTLDQKPPKTRTAVEGFGAPNEPAQNFILIYDGTNSYTCSKEASAPVGQCFKSSQAGGLGDLLSLDSILKELDTSLEVKTAGSRTIAGADSQCFDVKEKDSDTSLACFSKRDGIMTFTEVKDTDTGNTTKIEATKLSTSVADSVFAPPQGWTILGQ